MAENKVGSRDEVAQWIASRRAASTPRIVFTSGVFDLIHPGHVDYLERARALGDLLVVGVNSDESVRELKGLVRPIVSESARVRVIAGLGAVDRVFVFPERDNQTNIRILKPEIYVKGGDYTPGKLTSSSLVGEYGGKVEILPFLKGYSSTSLIEQAARAVLGISPAPPSPRYQEAAPCVFLDRDGVLNHHAEYVSRPEDLHIVPGVPEAIRKLNDAGFRVAVVTNQQGIGLGYFTEKDFFRIMKKLLVACGEAGARIDRIYFCPHSLAEGCHCRKPGIELLKRGERELHVDLSRSFMVGDMTSDVVAGAAAGCRTVLVRTGKGGSDGLYPDAKPSAIVSDIVEAVDYILASV